MRVYKSVGAFAADNDRIAKQVVGRFGDVLLDDVAGEVSKRVAREPVLTGKLRGSRVFLKGGPGQPSIVGWTAPYAAIIARGRKRSKPYRRKGSEKQIVRMLGSKQQRTGFIRPMFFGLRRDWEQVVARAAQKVGG